MCYILMVNDEVYRDKIKGGTNLGFFYYERMQEGS